MSTEKKGNDKMQPPKPKGNYQLWVILVTVAVILGVVYINSTNNLKEVTQGDIENMIKSGDVKKIALIQDQKIVELTLTEDALKNAKYNDIEEGFGTNK